MYGAENIHVIILYNYYVTKPNGDTQDSIVTDMHFVSGLQKAR